MLITTTGGPDSARIRSSISQLPPTANIIVRLRDVSGAGGEDHAYRFNIREPRADFRLTVSPRNPNVPAGGTVPLTVTALRLDGFDGPIEICVDGLPAGMHAANGRHSTRTDVHYGASHRGCGSEDGASGAADCYRPRQFLTRYANPEDKLKFVALMPQPDVTMTAETKEIMLEPGAKRKSPSALPGRMDSVAVYRWKSAICRPGSRSGCGPQRRSHQRKRDEADIHCRGAG